MASIYFLSISDLLWLMWSSGTASISIRVIVSRAPNSSLFIKDISMATSKSNEIYLGLFADS